MKYKSRALRSLDPQHFDLDLRLRQCMKGSRLFQKVENVSKVDLDHGIDLYV